MAAHTQKITLSPSRDIPFNKLVLSQSNVRRIKAGVSIEELAEDIARRGLLQGLNVRPVFDPEGRETGMFEIPAGGRRYCALDLLVKKKRLAKTALVPCVVRDPSSDILAEDDSLAENIQRAPLHPLDQFRAFQALRDKGQSEEEIAAAFFVSANVVKQRLRLAAVSQKLLDIYAEDEMSLEQLMAFTICEDHARQEKVWEALPDWNRHPHQIRRMLTERTVPADDRRVRFVGLDAYEAAGGTIIRDLFDEDNGGWLENISLLDRLVAEKLKAEAEKLTSEGWKWIEVATDFPYGHVRCLRELTGTEMELTAEDRAIRAALEAENLKLETEYEGADELPKEVDERLAEIEDAIAAFEDRPLAYDPAEVTRAGVFVSLGRDGRLLVDRGYVRPKDEPAVNESDADLDANEGEPDGTINLTDRVTIIHVGGEPEPNDDEENVVKPLPDRLVAELTAHRTLALRDALADNPRVAMTALLHKLVLDHFVRGHVGGSCLQATVSHVFFPAQNAELKDSPSAKSVEARHEAWSNEIPKDDDALWDWLESLHDSQRLQLQAHCLSYGVNALYERADRSGAVSSGGVARRLKLADRLACCVGLDMVKAGWKPTVENYLGRVPKPRILEAVLEAKGERAAQLIEHLKKPDMAKEAERLLDGTGWLPEPLRGGELPTDDDVLDNAGDGEALPDFLDAHEADIGAE